MKLFCLSFSLALLLNAWPLGVQADGSGNASNAEGPEWIYWRQYETYFRLLKFADVPEKTRAEFRQQAYLFFFRYWAIHRSQYASLPPVQRFEEDFALLLKNRALSQVDQDDPLQVKSHYKNGVFVFEPLPKDEGGFHLTMSEEARLPHMEALPARDFKTWEGYQKYVSAFKAFIETSAKNARKEPNK